MRNLMKLSTVATVLVLAAGLAFAGGQLHSLDKVAPQKDGYTGPMDRGFLDCSGAIEVDLGVGVYTGDTTGAVNNVSAYSCSTWDESGGEVVYHCVMPDGVTWEVGLSDMSCDLDLIVLDQCDEDLGCLGVFNSVVYTSEPVPGDFYFVVDGYAGAACSYTLTFTTTPYIAPPTGCDQVMDVANGTYFTGDTCDGFNSVSSEDCSTYTENGLEDWYEIEMQPGASFTASVTNTADGALWVLDACDGWNCLAYADATLSGGTEVVSYTNTTGMVQTVYLVIDSWGTDSCGTYEMTFDPAGGAIATEAMSMGQIKSLYR